MDTIQPIYVLKLAIRVWSFGLRRLVATQFDFRHCYIALFVCMFCTASSTAVNGGDESGEDTYVVLQQHLRNLEASHRKLQEQFEVVLEEKNIVGTQNMKEESEGASGSDEMTSLPSWGFLPGGHFFRSPYRNVLRFMGCAVYVSRIGSGEIVYWNRAAQKIFGYKDYEAVGQRFLQLLFDEKHHLSALEIIKRLNNGEPWRGQLLPKTKYGRDFVARVDMTPLYEGGELVGIVTVSIEDPVFKSPEAGNERSRVVHGNGKLEDQRRNMKGTQWLPWPHIAAVPLEFAKPPKMASIFFSKFQTRSNSNLDKKVQINGLQGNSTKHGDGAAYLLTNSLGSPSQLSNVDANNNTNDASQHISPGYRTLSSNGMLSGANKVSTSGSNSDGREVVNSELENADLRLSDFHEIQSPEEADSGSVDDEICWEDLQIKEEVGHGSFAVVHRGVWNGSDVAVKVYHGNLFSEATMADYQKEIDIMRRVRHPNVLLFMGAVSSEEKLAIVTEYLTRGSLFKTIHRSNQSLDIRRRLKMAIDVARGMNYLHNRNPPIVHRDLKSSNLLVDKSWTVKVGDFGLSKLKHTTFLTARSGRGTPQWMAPEVLRNEPSTEKSDIFSFGVVLWELMTECIPWNNVNSLQVVGIVGFQDRRLDLPENMDTQVSSIISDCWQSNPEDRPSFEAILNKMTSMVQTGSGIITTRTAAFPYQKNYYNHDNMRT